MASTRSTAVSANIVALNSTNAVGKDAHVHYGTDGWTTVDNLLGGDTDNRRLNTAPGVVADETTGITYNYVPAEKRVVKVNTGNSNVRIVYAPSRL